MACATRSSLFRMLWSICFVGFAHASRELMMDDTMNSTMAGGDDDDGLNMLMTEGMGMGDMSSMAMSGSGGLYNWLFFHKWMITNRNDYVWSLFFVFALAVVGELIKSFHSHYDYYAMTQWSGKSLRDLHFTPFQQFVRGAMKLSGSLINSALMLIIMSFDIGYIFAIAIGVGLSYAFLNFSFAYSTNSRFLPAHLKERIARFTSTASLPSSYPFVVIAGCLCVGAMVIYTGIYGYAVEWKMPFMSGYSYRFGLRDLFEKDFLICWWSPFAAAVFLASFWEVQETSNGTKAPSRVAPSSGSWGRPIWCPNPFFIRSRWLGGISVGNIIVFVLIVLLNTLWFVGTMLTRMKPRGEWETFTSDKRMHLVAVSLAYPGIWNLAFSLALVVRNQLLLRFFDVDLTVATPLHAYLAGLSLIFIVLHGVCLLSVYGRLGQLPDYVDPRLSTPGFRNMAGIFAMFTLIIIAAGSYEGIRTRFYRLFLWNKQLYVLFTFWACIHTSLVAYVIVPFIVYLIHDKLSALFLSQEVEKTATITAVSEHTVRIDIRAKNGGKLTPYSPGAHVQITVPSFSQFDKNPFSIASLWKESPHKMTVFASVKGGVTKALYTEAAASPETSSDLLTREVPVHVYGYYEKKTPYYLSYDKVVFAAAGTGLSALLSHIKNYVEHSAFAVSERKVHLVWVVRNRADLRAYAPLLVAAAGESSIDLSEVQIDIYITGDAEELSPLSTTGEKPDADDSNGTFFAGNSKSYNESKDPESAVFELESADVIGEDKFEEEYAKIARGHSIFQRLFVPRKPVVELVVDFVKVYKKVLLSVIAAGSLIGGMFLARASHPDWQDALDICQGDLTYKSDSRTWFNCFIWFNIAPLVLPVSTFAILGSVFLRITSLLLSYESASSAGGFKDEATLVSSLPISAARTDSATNALERSSTLYTGRPKFLRIFRLAVAGSDVTAAEAAKQRQSYSPVAMLTAGPKPFVEDVIYNSLAYPSLHTFRHSL